MVVGSAGCSPSLQPPVRIGAIAWPGYEGLFLARALGAFGSAPVKLVDYPSTPEVIRSFRNGAIEAACLSADEFLRLAADEPDLRAILVMDISRGADALVVHPHIANLPSLSGKRVGVELNAIGAYMLTLALRSAGLKKDEITVVPLSNDLHEQAFLERSIDAVVTFEPHRTRLLKSGATVLFDSSNLEPPVMDFLVVRQSLIDERPGLVRQILSGWFEAIAFLKSHPQEAAALVAPRQGVTPAEFLQSMELLQIPSLEQNRLMLAHASEETLRQMRALNDAMLATGLHHSVVTRTNLFHGASLP